MNGRMITSWAKLKYVKYIYKWKENFLDVFENPPEVTDKFIKNYWWSSNSDNLRKKNLQWYRKKLKAGNLQTSMKSFLEYGRQKNLMIYFDSATLSINTTQLKDGQLVAFPRKMISKSPRTTEAELLLLSLLRFIMLWFSTLLNSRKFSEKIRKVFGEID